MAKNLETIVFDASQFQRELAAFGKLLNSKSELSERDDIQPFFKKRKHLTAFMGTFSPNVGTATELAFNYPFFGDFSADVLLGNKKAGAFCVVEFEDAHRHSIFKKAGARATPEWGSRFEHGFSQIVDWFCSLDDFKNTGGFEKMFGRGHINFSGLLVIGRNAGLDDTQRRRLKWRTDKVLIDSRAITCITFDDLYALLHERFDLYRAACAIEKKRKR